jgi:hypothetical protein
VARRSRSGGGRAALLVLCVSGAAPACGDDGEGMAWEPTAGSGAGSGSASGSGNASEGSASDGDTTAGGACEPGDVEPCLCPDGLSLGEQHCDGASFGACECEGEDGSTGDPMPPLPTEVCYLGADRAGTTCLPLVAFYDALPAGYEYPPGMSGDGQDRPPLGLVDLQGVDPALLLAPNFALDELAQLAVGRYAVLQPHAVASLQAMRDQLGGIAVHTGYLSPSANAAAGEDEYARYQYGDGFELSPNSATLPELSAACTAGGGTVVELGATLRCEWSSVPLDEAFFGPP